MESFNLDKSIEEIDCRIIEYNMAAENLKLRRCELLAQKVDADIADVIEYALEVGIQPKRMVELISDEARRAAFQEDDDE